MEDLYPLVYDERLPETRVEFGMTRAEVAALQAATAAAEQWAACADVIREARAYPEVFVDEPFLAEGVDFAVRAAVADLAVRLGISENVVRNDAHAAELLMARTPTVWAWFRTGDMAATKARIVADLVSDLPSATWARFDAEMLARRALPITRFRAQARLVSAKLDPIDSTERHCAAVDVRSVWVESAPDGMAHLMLHLSEHEAHRAYAHVDRLARQALLQPGEQRTLAQLRADIATELVAGSLSAGTGVGYTIAVTIPVETLLGLSERPGTVDGMIPIDAETARQLAGDSKEWHRVLTDPIRGTVLDYDRGRYRPPAALARLVRATHPVCDFPGCGRPSQACDLDHTRAWAHDGRTCRANLRPLCSGHHRLKHGSKWRTTGRSWRSPTGHDSEPDPPPF